MGIKEVKKNPINMMVADADDQTLEAVIQLRKKVGSQEERLGFVKGLYYISLVDADYTGDEKALVEGTACALGINESTLTYMEHEINDDPDASIDSFATAGSREYRQQLFEEMAALTYLKGYQLAEEDRAMMKVAKAMGIKEDKAEKTMYELYMAIAAGVAICAVTAGVAAPAIGAAIGGMQGLTGIAAVNAGLAALGGGAIAAGGGGVAAGTAAIITAGAVAGGSAAAVGISVKENITAAHDKKKLQAAIKQQQKDNMTKQEITENLIKAIELEKDRLKQLEELHVSRRDIASIELQIANLLAQKAEIAASMES